MVISLITGDVSNNIVTKTLGCRNVYCVQVILDQIKESPNINRVRVFDQGKNPYLPIELGSTIWAPILDWQIN